MKKKIFRSIFLTSIAVLILTLTSTIYVMYNNTLKEYKREAGNEAAYIANALNSSDNDDVYLRDVEKKVSNRITLIDKDGMVLYDNYTKESTMDNHLNRPEINESITKGAGSSIRKSATLGRDTYYYAIRLDDNKTIRIGIEIDNILGILGNSVVMIIIIVCVVVAISFVIAGTLTKSIIKPINELNIDKPLSNDTYEELSTLLVRIDRQNTEIREKINLIEESKKELNYISDNMNEGLVIISNSGSVLSVNKSAIKILGKNASTYQKLCRDIEYISVVKKALSGEHASSRMEKDSGIYQLLASPVKESILDNNSEGIYAVILFIVDITDKEMAEKVRREFSANVSHELKTPLTSIMGRAELISEGIAMNSDIPQFAKDIQKESARLLQLIDDIIKISKLDEDKYITEFANVNLTKIVNMVKDNLADKASKMNITYNVECEEVSINGIEPVLYEIVYNMCDNAINYNKMGGDVEVTLKKEDNLVLLTVKDSGIGIDNKHQKRIFERFYRIDKSHSKQTGGTGLGLSIVKHGAMLHNADIKLESKEGCGTRIVIEFHI